MIASFGVPSHPATAAGRSSSSRPSPTRMPTAAWVMLFAMLHDVNVVSAVTGPPGPKIVSGCDAIPLEHDLAALHHEQREADSVRSSVRKQFVGDPRDRFVHLRTVCAP